MSNLSDMANYYANSKNTKRIPVEEFRKLLEEAPDKCPITRLELCRSFGLGNQVVYLSNPPYYAYSLPWLDKESMSFYRIRYDMSNQYNASTEFVCTVGDLKGRPDEKSIREFYEIDRIEAEEEGMEVCGKCKKEFDWDDTVVVVGDVLYHADCVVLVASGFLAFDGDEYLGEVANDHGSPAYDILEEDKYHGPNE